MKMKIENVKFQRRQLGWVCQIGFRFASNRQFTDEYQEVEVCRKWWIVAYFAARWHVKFHIAVHGATKTERQIKGWGI